ncbi:MAG: zf-TFIIB domain-containing protein [Methylococcaceae bacterium]|nr:zf-TFIIB domain-containing protein [Methylococcaceae bacterium]MCI0733067.1 zf-TFIIB domain-containing protein [Methylococcaceae bacterium]
MGNLTVDICQGGCGGIWFDQFELKKLDETHEHEGEELLSVERDPTASVDHGVRRHCPKCESTLMMRHFFSVKRGVEVDECQTCAGYWLDQGELGRIRSEYSSEAERKAAAGAVFDEIFGKELEQMRAKSREDHAKARKIANALRFISPSYYLPGKQDGGAF